MGMKKLAALVMALVLCLTAAVAMAEEKVLVINNLEELMQFRDNVNNKIHGHINYSGWTVKLNADIDLKNEEWTPIGWYVDSKNNNYATFSGTFDGQGHTISNLYINQEKESNQGLFGYTTDGEVKNLTIHNADVTGRLNVGAVAGTPYTSKYTNIKVSGHVEVNGMSYVGGVLGKNVYANVTDITVNVDSTSYVRAVSTENGVAYRTYVGGVIGFMGEGGHTVKNVTSNIAVYGDVCDIGGIAGIAHYGNNFVNCKMTGDVYYEGTNSEDAVEIGTIAGVWHNMNGYTVTFNECESTGKINGLPEGTQVHNGGLVGAPYTSSSFKGESENSGTLSLNGKTFKNENQQAAQAPEYKPVKAEESKAATTKPVSGKPEFQYLVGETYSGQAAGLAFRSTAQFYPHFTQVRVYKDGQKSPISIFDADDCDPKQVEIKEGSIVVTFKPSYLDTLEEGKYEVEIIPHTDMGNEGITSGTFTISKPNGTGAGDLPQTGDSSSLALWIGLMALCAGAFAVRSRKTRAN